MSQTVLSKILTMLPTTIVLLNARNSAQATNTSVLNMARNVTVVMSLEVLQLLKTTVTRPARDPTRSVVVTID